MMQPQLQCSRLPRGNRQPIEPTDDQFQAVLVAVSAAIAFSNPIQEKLGTTVPNFLVDASVARRVCDFGRVAALMFYQEVYAEGLGGCGRGALHSSTAVEAPDSLVNKHAKQGHGILL